MSSDFSPPPDDTSKSGSASGSPVGRKTSSYGLRKHDDFRVEDHYYNKYMALLGPSLKRKTKVKRVPETMEVVETLHSERGKRRTRTLLPDAEEDVEEEVVSKKRFLKPKPLKVCDVGRNRRIGIVASTLQELCTKIRDHFEIARDDEFEVVLEEDCTGIADEEYFQTLPDNTVLMAVCQGGRWTKALTSLAEDTRGLVEVDGAGPSSSATDLARVVERIARNPATMAFLPKMDLEVVADSDVNQLQVLLRQSKDDAQFIQDACEQRLNELIRSEEASALLKLYNRAKTEKDNGSM